MICNECKSQGCCKTRLLFVECHFFSLNHFLASTIRWINVHQKNGLRCDTKECLALWYKTILSLCYMNVTWLDATWMLHNFITSLMQNSIDAKQRKLWKQTKLASIDFFLHSKLFLYDSFGSSFFGSISSRSSFLWKQFPSAIIHYLSFSFFLLFVRQKQFAANTGMYKS